MPEWAVSLLVKLAIDFLQREGVISAVTAAAARLVADTKTYYRKEDFPGGVNGQPDTPLPDLDNGTNTNMTVGGYHDRGPP